MVYKKRNRDLPEGLKFPKRTKELTPAEKEILHLISDEFLTVKQIQQRRNCSKQAVYKIIRKLKQKGALDSGLRKVYQNRPTNLPINSIRLHGQEWNLKVLWQDHYFQKQLRKCNVLFIDGNTIKLYRNSIEVYSDNSFFGADERQADKSSQEYWKRFFARLEHEFKVILMKDRSHNIKEVNHHYARIDSKLCEHAIENKYKIRIFAEEDGKLCYLTDNSFGLKEDETVHPVTAKQDRESISKHINDIRLNNPMTNSEIVRIQAETIRQAKITAQNIDGIVQNQQVFDKNMSSHLKILNKIGKAIDNLSKTVGKLCQTRISDYDK